MKPLKNNPRRLSNANRKKLEECLEEYGDLSGIVHDEDSDEIISGNQRASLIDIDNCHIELVKVYPKPTRTGTIAEGYVVFENERFNYRKVHWDYEKCQRAAIIANKVGGEWDEEILALFDEDVLLDGGFTEDDLDAMFRYDFPPETEKDEEITPESTKKDEKEVYYRLEIVFKGEDECEHHLVSLKEQGYDVRRV